MPTPDLLSALVAYLRATASVTALVPAEKITTEIAQPGPDPPYLLLTDYAERLPGETAEDSQAELTVVVVTNDGLDHARTVGVVVKAAIDNPNGNPSSLARSALSWTGGVETSCFRNDSHPRRLAGIGRGGRYFYVEEIDYVFWVAPA